MLNRFMLDAAAANRARDEFAGGDEHLAAGFLRCAALGLDHRYANERHPALRQLGQSFDKSMWRGHKSGGQGAGSWEFFYTSILASTATPISAPTLSNRIRRHR